MAKQDPKKTLADKKAAGKKQGEQQAAATRTKPAPKVKGPVPDFTPNKVREEAHNLNAFAKAIVDGQQRFSALVAGIEGVYLVGTTKGQFLKGHSFVVKTITFPKKDDRDAFDQLVIEEYAPVDLKFTVRIPHSWLFRPFAKCKFAQGAVGEVQQNMLAFLKEMLAKEIDFELARREEARMALAATKAMNVAADSAAKLATADKTSKKTSKAKPAAPVAEAEVASTATEASA